MTYRVLEICAGAGGQALGLEAAGFEHSLAVEIDEHACATLQSNRPDWKVVRQDVRCVSGRDYSNIDLLAGGVPCPPFSVAGKQLGPDDDRDLFPEALRLTSEIEPRAVLLENVPGFASEKFRAYRSVLIAKFRRLGYVVDYRILNARDFGVPQLRPRFVLVALRPDDVPYFRWPLAKPDGTKSVGDTLADLMAARGWPGATTWKLRARGIAPTIVGGSKKHGGPDLGPTRARRQWLGLGVNGLGIADAAPDISDPIDLLPKLTLKMVARIQGFPDTWKFEGKKTAAYRQIGNAFPPPVAEAVGRALRSAFERVASEDQVANQARLFDRALILA